LLVVSLIAVVEGCFWVGVLESWRKGAVCEDIYVPLGIKVLKIDDETLGFALTRRFARFCGLDFNVRLLQNLGGCG
jgi:hypothetical protein